MVRHRLGYEASCRIGSQRCGVPSLAVHPVQCGCDSARVRLCPPHPSTSRSCARRSGDGSRPGFRRARCRTPRVRAADIGLDSVRHRSRKVSCLAEHAAPGGAFGSGAARFVHSLFLLLHPAHGTFLGVGSSPEYEDLAGRSQRAYAPAYFRLSLGHPPFCTSTGTSCIRSPVRSVRGQSCSPTRVYFAPSSDPSGRNGARERALRRRAALTRSALVHAASRAELACCSFVGRGRDFPARRAASDERFLCAELAVFPVAAADRILGPGWRAYLHRAQSPWLRTVRRCRACRCTLVPTTAILVCDGRRGSDRVRSVVVRDDGVDLGPSRLSRHRQCPCARRLEINRRSDLLRDPHLTASSPQSGGICREDLSWLNLAHVLARARPRYFSSPTTVSQGLVGSTSTARRCGPSTHSLLMTTPRWVRRASTPIFVARLRKASGLCEDAEEHGGLIFTVTAK